MQIFKTVSKAAVDTIEESAVPLQVAVVNSLGVFALAAVWFKNVLKPSVIESEYDCALEISTKEKELADKGVEISDALKKRVSFLDSL